MKVKVKIALEANSSGQWVAYGYPNADVWGEMMDAFEPIEGGQRFWIEAEVEVSDVVATVIGSAVAAE
jgi:hypothetical protein